MMKTKPAVPLRYLFFYLFLVPGMATGVFAAPIQVSNSAGQSMTVEVLSYTESSGNVRIQRTDGQIFNTKIDVFDAASREKIIASAPKEIPRVKVDVSVGKKRRDVRGSSYMEYMTVTTSATVTNESRDTDLDETEFTILLVGRNSRRYANRNEDWYKILSVQRFTAQLVAGNSSQYELKPIETQYDSDKDSSNVGGWEYEGYLLVGQDPEGAILYTKTTLGEVGTTTVKEEKRLREALQLQEGAETNHDLSRRGR